MKTLLFLIETHWVLGLVSLLSLMVALVLFCAPLRRFLLTPVIFRLFKSMMPPLSKNEAEALSAGTVGAEASLLGKPDWDRLAPSSYQPLSLEEEVYLREKVDSLCAMLDSEQIERDGNLPPAVWAHMKAIGIFGMNAPKEYGGLGFSKFAQSQIIAKIASRSLDAAITAMVPNSLGPAELIAHYGTPEQKAHWLPRLANGAVIPCFALTSPTAGSDASSLIDTGVVCGTKKEPLICLNGNKRYITLAPIADVVGFACRLYDPQGILGGAKDLGITLVLIPVNDYTTTRGLSIGRRHDPLGSNFLNGPVVVHDLIVPLEESVIGGRAMVGRGWRLLMECLFAGRGVSLPSISIGAAQSTVALVGLYARIRKQFGQSLADFGAIEEWLARMAGNLYLMEAVGRVAARSVDEGNSSPVLSAIAKSHCTERMREVVCCGMDILGGKGIMQGVKNFLGRYYAMLPVAITVEGANRVTDGLMVGGQGLTRCHPALSKEMEAVAHADSVHALALFDAALVIHVRYVTCGFFRALFHAFGGWRLSPAPIRNGKKYKLHQYYQKLNRVSSAFGFLSEVMIWALGGKLKMEERISERLGKVLSALVIGSSILARFAEDGEPDEDLPLVEWGLAQSLMNAQSALLGVLANFPRVFGSHLSGTLIAWCVARMLFPFGKPFYASSDRVEQKIARIVTTTNAARRRLIEGVYVPDAGNMEEMFSLFEAAMKSTFCADPIEKKIRRAIKKKIIHDPYDLDAAVLGAVIDSTERDVLAECYALRDRVIAVDSFEADDPRFSS